MADQRSPGQLTQEIVEAAIAFVGKVDGTLLHGDFDCTGPMSGLTCECGWTQLTWAVGRLHKAADDADLTALLAELGQTEVPPGTLRAMLHARGWRKDDPR